MVRTLRRLTVAAMAMAALVPAGASAQVLTSQSGWFWGNPTPQGELLSDVDFAGPRGYAVGEFGTALRTDDGGATWRGLRTGTTVGLDRVQAVDTNTVIVSGKCSVRRSTDGGATFSRLPFTASEQSCPSKLTALDFPDPATGYIALDNGTVLRTVDGGRSFSERTPLPGTATAPGAGNYVQALAFSGPNAGVALVNSGVAHLPHPWCRGDQESCIYRTVDGGNTWTLATGVTGYVMAIDFASPSTGFAVGGETGLLRTQDGGASFAERPFTGGGAGQPLMSVDCASVDTCLMTIFPDRLAGTGGLARTTDAGATSTAVSSPSGLGLRDAAFSGAAGAAAVGESGTTIVSNDAGASFTNVGSRLTGNFAFLRTSGQRVYAPGLRGRVARSLDGGRTWSAVAVPTSSPIRDVSFPTHAIGFALGQDGGLQRTENAGHSWQILDTSTSSDPSALTAVDGNQVILVGPRGVRRSGDGGRSFSAVRSGAVHTASLADVDRAGNAVFAYGRRALALSTNGGRTWRKLRLPKGNVADLDFVTSRSGFLRTTSGRLYKTQNRGRRWREVLTGTGRIGKLAFADARRGWIAAPGADVLRTSDSGRSWQPQDITENGTTYVPENGIGYSTTNEITSIVALSGTAAVALSGTATAAFDGLTERFYATNGGGGIGGASRLSLTPSKRRLTKTTRVRIRGRLKPARGGELVSVLSRTGTRWSRRAVRAAANGTFTLTYRVRRSTVFVAQWSGDDRSAGDGTTAVKVTVKKRKRKRR